MNTTMLVMILGLILHVTLCAPFFFRRNYQVIGGAVFFIMLLLPVFGPISALVLRNIIADSRDGILEQSIHDYEYDYVRVVTDEKDQPQRVVPLEETLLINDRGMRRQHMLDILRHEPSQFIHLLKVARLNEDTEVAHYATATIMEVQRDFDVDLQSISADIKEYPDNMGLLDKYLTKINEYIKSGLVSGYLLDMHRRNYENALFKRLEIDPLCKQTHFYLFQNYLNMQAYNEAELIVNKMKELWPADENVWISAMTLYLESKDKTKKDLLLHSMAKTSISWTTQGKNKTRFLCGEDFFS